MFMNKDIYRRTNFKYFKIGKLNKLYKTHQSIATVSLKKNINSGGSLQSELSYLDIHSKYSL